MTGHSTHSDNTSGRENHKGMDGRENHKGMDSITCETVFEVYEQQEREDEITK